MPRRNSSMAFFYLYDIPTNLDQSQYRTYF